jgi:hypothetical protein
MKPPESQGYFDRRDPRSAVIAHSEFPAFRVQGDTFHLIVRDLDGETVAEFDLPYDGPRATETWEPVPLPASSTIDGVTLTLTDVQAKVNDPYWVNNSLTYGHRLEVTGELSYEGTPIGLSYFNTTVATDALGNTSYGDPLNLSWGEEAWKLRLTPVPLDWTLIPVDPSETAEIGTFTLPTGATVEPLAVSASVGSRMINWQYLGGPNAIYDFGYTGTGWGTYSSGVYLGENYDQYIGLNFEDPSYGQRRLTVVGNAYTLIGTAPGYGYYSGTEYVKITTPDGVEIPCSPPTPLSDLLVVAFIPPEGVTEVVATYVVRDTLPEFEFLIAPPERPPLPAPQFNNYGVYSPYSSYATPPYSSYTMPVPSYATPVPYAAPESMTLPESLPSDATLPVDPAEVIGEPETTTESVLPEETPSTDEVPSAGAETPTAEAPSDATTSAEEPPVTPAGDVTEQPE